MPKDHLLAQLVLSLSKGTRHNVCPLELLLCIFSCVFLSPQYKMPAPDADGLGPEIKDNTDGSICVQYHPNKSGRHEVQMCYEGCAVEGEQKDIRKKIFAFFQTIN